MNAEIKKWISEEISRQLREIDERVKTCERKQASSNQLVLRQEQTLLKQKKLMDEQADVIVERARDLVETASKNITAGVMARVNQEIQTKVMPVVRQNEQWLNYHTEDHHKVINDFRQDVMGENRRTRGITDGRNDPTMLRSHVHMAFEYD